MILPLQITLILLVYACDFNKFRTASLYNLFSEVQEVTNYS